MHEQQSTAQLKTGPRTLVTVFGRNSLVATLLLGVAQLAASRGIDERLDFSRGMQSIGSSYGRALMQAAPAQQNILRTYAPAVQQHLLELAQSSDPRVNEAYAAKRASEELQAIRRMTVRELLLQLLTHREQSLILALPEIDRFMRGRGIDFDPGVPDYKVRREGDRVSLSLSAKFRVKNTSKQFKLDLEDCAVGVGLDDRILGGVREGNLCGPVPVLGPGEVAAMDVRYEALNQDHAAAIARAVDAGQRTRVTFVLLPAGGSSIKDERYTYKLNDLAIRGYRTELSQIQSDIAVLRRR